MIVGVGHQMRDHIHIVLCGGKKKAFVELKNGHLTDNPFSSAWGRAVQEIKQFSYIRKMLFRLIYLAGFQAEQKSLTVLEAQLLSN